MAGPDANSGQAAPVLAGDARERLLQAARELFSREGVRAVGIDAIIERSGVARQTLYRHFDSNDQDPIHLLEQTGERFVTDGEPRESSLARLEGARLASAELDRKPAGA